MDELPQSLSSKSYMNLEDLESYRNEGGGGGEYSEQSSIYHYHHMTRATKSQLFLYGFCTGIVSQLIVFGCVDAFFGESMSYPSSGVHAVTKTGGSSASASASASAGGTVYEYIPPSPKERFATACALLVICFTSCLGVFYILSFMPIFHQSGRKIRIRIRKIEDDDHVDNIDEEEGEGEQKNGMLFFKMKILVKDVRNSMSSFCRRLSSLDTFFSLGHLTGGYIVFLITDIRIGSFSAIELHLGLYAIGVAILACLFRNGIDADASSGRRI